MLTQLDHDESEWLNAFEQGQLKSVANRSELTQFKAAARDIAQEEGIGALCQRIQAGFTAVPQTDGLDEINAAVTAERQQHQDPAAPL